MNHRKDGAPGLVDRAASLIEKSRTDALLAHAEAFGLRARVAGEKLVRDAALPRHSRNLPRLFESVYHASDLVVAPAPCLATVNRARKKLGQRLATEQGPRRNRGEPTAPRA